MSAASFDSLGTANSLEAVGIERRQAEAIAIAIRSIEGNLATKEDMSTIKWVLGILSAVCLANFAAVLLIAARVL